MSYFSQKKSEINNVADYLKNMGCAKGSRAAHEFDM